MASVENWVWLSNLAPLLEEISAMAGEGLDEGLRRVFVDEIRKSDTDASPPRWASCHFDGPNPILAQAGIDRGTDVLFVRLELPDDLRCRADTTLGLLQTYSVAVRNRPSV